MLKRYLSMLGAALCLIGHSSLAATEAGPTSTPGVAPSSQTQRACHSIAGVQFSRLIWDADSGCPVNDGKTLATAGMLCPIVSGRSYGLDAGASLGTVVGSRLFADPEAVAALNLGVNYDGLVTVGLAPHWLTARSLGDPASYGLGFFASFTFEAWAKAITDTVAKDAAK